MATSKRLLERWNDYGRYSGRTSENEYCAEPAGLTSDDSTSADNDGSRRSDSAGNSGRGRGYTTPSSSTIRRDIVPIQRREPRFDCFGNLLEPINANSDKISAGRGSLRGNSRLNNLNCVEPVRRRSDRVHLNSQNYLRKLYRTGKSFFRVQEVPNDEVSTTEPTVDRKVTTISSVEWLAFLQLIYHLSETCRP